MQSKIEQFYQQVSDINIDYTIIKDNIIVDEIIESIKSSSNSWSDTCHADSHFENGHVDNHFDSHPDCGKDDDLLGETQDVE